MLGQCFKKGVLSMLPLVLVGSAASYASVDGSYQCRLPGAEISPLRLTPGYNDLRINVAPAGKEYQLTVVNAPDEISGEVFVLSSKRDGNAVSELRAFDDHGEVTYDGWYASDSPESFSLQLEINTTVYINNGRGDFYHPAKARFAHHAYGNSYNVQDDIELYCYPSN